MAEQAARTKEAFIGYVRTNRGRTNMGYTEFDLEVCPRSTVADHAMEEEPFC